MGLLIDAPILVSTSSMSITRVFRRRGFRDCQVDGMRQTISCLIKLGGTTDFYTVSLCSSYLGFGGFLD